jgi:tetratricopeptide (TPR) repeat protein
VTDRSPRRQEEVIVAASQAIADGAYGDARASLSSALDANLFGDQPNVAAFWALRLYGEASRKQVDPQTAARAYGAALQMANVMHRPDLESIAVEGQAIVARISGEPAEALALFDRARDLAEEGDDIAGVVALLSNKGNLLAEIERFEEAESVLREALGGMADPDPRLLAGIEDNLGAALAGQHRYEEAMTMAASAARRYEAIGAGFDRYEALCHLEFHQHGAGEHEAAVQTFIEAHGLITTLEARNVNVGHYRAYPERVRRIEENTIAVLAADGLVDFEADFEIGTRATLASELFVQAGREIEAGEFAPAEPRLLQALEHWERLQAVHMLPSIHHSLANLYFEAGQTTKAREHGLRAREIAFELGDAYRELLACGGLARQIMNSADDFGAADALHYIARAQALIPLSAGDGRGALPNDAPTLDSAVLDMLDSSICLTHGAFGLAEEATRRALGEREGRPDQSPESELMRYRTWLRQLRLYVILRRRNAQGDSEDADELEERFIAYLDGEPDLRSSVSLQATLGNEGFIADVWTEETLALLVGACDAYEEMRERVRTLGDLSGFSESVHAPFAEAIEVAVHLGHDEQALHLLERSKARSLLDALAIDGGGGADAAAVEPATATELATALAERTSSPALIDFFVGPRSVLAFVIDGRAEFEVRHLADPRSDEWIELTTLVRRSALSGEGSALRALTLPVLRRLTDCVREVGDGRPVYLSPHGILHSLPLHLVENDGILTPLPRVYHLPSGSLLRIPAAPETGEGSLVGGDPGSDLGFARAEAREVAARFSAQEKTGTACSFEWLSEALVPGQRRLRLIHLACHALFRPTKGERSGLGLTKGGVPTFVTVPELATLNWGSDLVMVSACSSGQQEVGAGDEPAGIPRALLGRGAKALIVSLWEVPDLATYLLVKNLYAELPDVGGLELQEVGRALVGAQEAVRDISARELVSTALDLHASDQGEGDLTRCALEAAEMAHRAARRTDQALVCYESLQAIEAGRFVAADIGGIDWTIQEEIATDPAYDVTPLRHPGNWAAFVLIGRR